ncbi:MAG: hypothetical protein JSV92_02310 [archaeon]|nr:MAG: hypothetical protein JSV92_02310 [archaeon]
MDEDEKFEKDRLKQYLEDHGPEILQDIEWCEKNIHGCDMDIDKGLERHWITVVPTKCGNFEVLKSDLEKAASKTGIYIKDEKSKEEIKGYVNGVKASKNLYKQLTLVYDDDMVHPKALILAKNKDKIDYMLLIQLRGENKRIMNFIDAYDSLSR